MSRDIIAAMAAAQALAMDTWGKGVPPGTTIEHVLDAGRDLGRLVDAEVRHVSLIERGLQQTLSRLFAECVGAMVGGDIQLPSGVRRRMPLDPARVQEVLVNEVFVPKNEAYDNSFMKFGAVGVVVRLIDKLAELDAAYAAWMVDEERGPLPKPLPHVANYATMTLVVLFPDLGT